MTQFDFFIYLIDLLVAQLVLGNDEHSQSQQNSRNNGYQPRMPCSAKGDWLTAFS